jgi:hypothetical protein
VFQSTVLTAPTQRRFEAHCPKRPGMIIPAFGPVSVAS